MSRKISIVEKRNWLQEYESGLSEHSLRKKHHKDLRTIKTGLEEARLNRDLSAARVEMMKDVLFKHQQRLQERLRDYQSSIKVPDSDASVLSWYQKENSVFSKESPIKPNELSSDQVTEMLQQHLKGNKIWKLTEDWQRAHVNNLLARETLQLVIFNKLKRLGFPVSDIVTRGKTSLCSVTVCPLFYRWALESTPTNKKIPGPEEEITADVERNGVMFRGNVLIESPESLEDACTRLKETYHRIKSLTEVKEVLNTHETVKNAAEKARRAIDDILLIDYIGGECPVCRQMSPI